MRNGHLETAKAVIISKIAEQLNLKYKSKELPRHFTHRAARIYHICSQHFGPLS